MVWREAPFHLGGRASRRAARAPGKHFRSSPAHDTSGSAGASPSQAGASPSHTWDAPRPLGGRASRRAARAPGKHFRSSPAHDTSGSAGASPSQAGASPSQAEASPSQESLAHPWVDQPRSWDHVHCLESIERNRRTESTSPPVIRRSYSSPYARGTGLAGSQTMMFISALYPSGGMPTPGSSDDTSSCRTTCISSVRPASASYHSISGSDSGRRCSRACIRARNTAGRVFIGTPVSNGRRAIPASGITCDIILSVRDWLRTPISGLTRAS